MSFRNKSSEQRFWIFQTNPSTTFRIFDWWKYWKEEWDTFWVKQYRNDIRKGDKAAIWVAQGNYKHEIRGIHAITEILTNPEIKKVLHEKLLFFIKPDERKKLSREPRLEVKIRYRKRLTGSDVILAFRMPNDPILHELRILKQPQGTNYKVTPQQWQRIMDLDV